MAALTINGKQYDVDVEADTPLLWVLRDNLGLAGTKFGCGAALCGACTVHIDGMAVRSCAIRVGQLAGRAVVTIENVAAEKDHPVVAAWIENQVPQCGYCQSGQIMAAVALLKRNPKPSDDDIDRETTNICRCGSYPEIRAAIHKAAAAMAKT